MMLTMGTQAIGEQGARMKMAAIQEGLRIFKKRTRTSPTVKHVCLRASSGCSLARLCHALADLLRERHGLSDA